MPKLYLDYHSVFDIEVDYRIAMNGDVDLRYTFHLCTKRPLNVCKILVYTFVHRGVRANSLCMADQASCRCPYLSSHLG